MKRQKLTAKQKARINFVVGVMLECNNDPSRAGHDDEYGVWYDCINAYIASINDYGIDVDACKNIDWNWHGNGDFAEDVQAKLDEYYDELYIYDDIVDYIADDAGSFRKPNDLPCDGKTEHDIRLVVRDCNTDDLYGVLYRSYLNVPVTRDEAIAAALDGLNEFVGHDAWQIFN